MISAARIVVLFAIALSCAHGEEGRFVSGAFQHPKEQQEHVGTTWERVLWQGRQYRTGIRR